MNREGSWATTNPALPSGTIGMMVTQTGARYSGTSLVIDANAAPSGQK